MSADPVKVQQTDVGGQCCAHKEHRPVTVINEKHHVFPEAAQIKLWGKIEVPLLYSLCATEHNSVHWLLDQWADGASPDVGVATYRFAHAALDAGELAAFGATPDDIYTAIRSRLTAQGLIDYDTARGHPRTFPTETGTP